MRRWFFAIPLCMFWLTAMTGNAAEKESESASAGTIRSESILASVNGEAITLADVMRESAPGEQTAFQVYRTAELPEHLEQLRRKTVDRIIDRRLLIQEFKRLNLELPPQFVENLLDELAENFGCKTRSELSRKARAAGTSIQELRDKASERIMSDMVIGREFYGAVNPTPKEMYEYFEAHAAEFSKPERVNLALLLLPRTTPKATVDGLARQLREKPDSFADAVKTLSGGPNRETGGAVGFLERSRLREEFLAALNQTPTPAAGTIMGPVETEEGYYFLRIAGIEPAVKTEFAAVQDEIRNRLEAEARTQALDMLHARLREKAVIRYYFGKDAVTPPSEAVAAVEPDHAKLTTPPVAKPPAKMEKKPMVTLKTNYGDIKIELYPDAAPETVKNFLGYVKAGFYNGTLFHRVIDNFMIQGGGFDRNFKQKTTNAPIQNEADNRLSNKIGTIAMARTADPHSATAQFFINVADNDFLDFRSPSPQYYGYCVFGKVVDGMDVVNKIRAVKTAGRGGHQDVPKEDVVLLEAVAEE